MQRGDLGTLQDIDAEGSRDGSLWGGRGHGDPAEPWGWELGALSGELRAGASGTEWWCWGGEGVSELVLVARLGVLTLGRKMP